MHANENLLFVHREKFAATRTGTKVRLLWHFGTNMLSFADKLPSLSFEGHLTKNMLCAEAKGADACQTDSGGPLIVLGESHKEDIQVGIVSW